MSLPVPGKIFQNRYLIIEEIGAGGMGLVYHARQLDAERDVSLKLLRRERAENTESIARFYREFKLLHRLSHPHIMKVYSLALDGNEHPFAVCEYLEGRSLRNLLKEETKLSWERATKIAVQICEAMQYIHNNGMVYRDLKPDNVIIQNCPGPDFVKIVDFGLISELNENATSEKITWTGQAVGSALYMSPEQTTARVDQRGDIYALGCVLFEMLAGEYLFNADTCDAIMNRHRNEDPGKRFACMINKVPGRLLELLSQILAKKPEERPPTMKDVKQQLLAILSDPETLIEAADYALCPVGKTNKSAVFCLILFVLALTIAGFSYFQNKQHELTVQIISATRREPPVPETLSPSILKARAAACQNRRIMSRTIISLSDMQKLQNDMLYRMETSKQAEEKADLQALLPGVLVETARQQFIAGQKHPALQTLARARSALTATTPALVRQQYYFLHASLSNDANQIENDLEQAINLAETSNTDNAGLFQSYIFAGSRLMEPGKYEKALPYVNKAIARSRLLPTREGLMLGLSLKITILKHLGAQPAADITHKELIQFIAAERDSALILDQAQLVYQLRAWETAEMLLQDSINCMQKSKQASKQTLPACIYLLENVHVRLANSESALNDFDLLLSLYDKYGSLPGVPPRAVIARQRADLTARL